MPTINLGKVRFTWRGDYNNANAYETNDVINYNGTSYVAVGDVAASASLTPPTDTNWEVFSQGVNDIATAAGDILYYNGTNLDKVSIGTTSQVLKVDANGIPEWSDNPVRSGTRVKSLPNQKYSYGGINRGLVKMFDGTLRAWGYGSNYMLGQGATTSARSYPGYVAFPPNTPEIQDGKWYQDHNTASGAIDADGDFWAWGPNSYGECGTGNSTAQYVPFNVSASVSNSLSTKDALHAYTGSDTQAFESWHVLATDGTVHSAGYNGYGQLGQGDTTNRNLFNQTPVLSGITQLAVGSQRYKHVLALKVDGNTNYVYSWGYNAQGQLGSGNTTQANIPMQIQYFNTNSIKIVEVRASYHSSYALADNGDLYSWGYNNGGQLGVGSVTAMNTPTLAATNVAEIFVGRNTQTSIWIKKTNGSLHAAGFNGHGHLSVDGTATNRQSFGPVVYNGGAFVDANVSKIVVGEYSSYMLKTDGTVWSVGYGANGNLGLGTTTNELYFKQVPIHRRSVTDISIMGNTTTSEGLLLLLDDGQLLMFGNGSNGQTADDDSDVNYVPNPIIF